MRSIWPGVSAIARRTWASEIRASLVCSTVRPATLQQHGGVVTHRTLLGDDGQPVVALAPEPIALPGVEHHHVSPPDAGEATLQDRGQVSGHHHGDLGRQPGQERQVEVVQVLVGDHDHVGARQLRRRQVRVVGERDLPQAEERTGR